MPVDPLPHPRSRPSRAWGGRAAIVLAAVLWSTSGLFAKSSLFADWPVEYRGPLMAFWRALFAALSLLPVVRRPRWRPAMAPMLIGFAVMNLTYMTAMAMTTAANAIWLQSTAPFWVLLFGWLVGLEPPRRGDLAALVFVACGVGLILCYELAAPRSAGALYGLFAGVAYALVVVSLRALRAENSAWLVLINNLATVVLLGPYVAWLGYWPHGAQWWGLAAFGALQIGLPYLLFTWGLRTVSSHEATGLVLLEPVLLPVWVMAVLGTETPAWWTVVGGGLILLGLTARYLLAETQAPGIRPSPGSIDPWRAPPGAT